MKRRASSVVTGALLVGAMVVALASPAWAPRAWGIPNLVAPCGTDKTFTGVLYLNDFDTKLTLIARGTVEGACVGGGSTVAVNTEFAVPASIEDASCDSISVAVDDITDEKQVTLDMSEAPILLDNPSNDPELRKQMCKVANRWRSGMYEKNLQRFVTDMDRILLAGS